MNAEKKVVLVNASFELGAGLFEWIKRYSKYYDEKFAYWDEFAFTTEHVPECNAVLIFNTPSKKIETRCFSENVIALMMEPGVYSEQPWMFKGLEQYANVYSPLNNSSNTILSPGYLGWHLLRDWNELSSLPVPEKTRDISCIASALTQFKGHRLRFDFIKKLKKEILSIDYYGKGSNYIPDKTDGLLPYRFSIVIENTVSPYYFTEKITDCFLTYTVPVYYGCSQIGKFFPENSFIEININKPTDALKKIRQIKENNDWGERLAALKEAREIVLNKYQPLAGAAAIFRNINPSPKKNVILEPVPETLIRKLKNKLQALIANK